MAYKKKKVCFFQYDLEPGGLQVYLLRFLIFKKAEIEPVIICKSGIGGEMQERFEELGFRVVLLRSLYFDLPAWLRIYRMYRKERFDAVCDLTANFAGIYLMLAWLAGVKKRMGYYGQSSDNFKPSFFNVMYNKLVNRLTYWFSTHIILNSQAALDFYFPYRNTTDKRFGIILNGVDSAAFSEEKDYTIRRELGIPDDAFVVGHTGRFDNRKNHGAIIGVAQLLKSHKDIHFIVCGKDTDKVPEMTSDPEVRSHIHALGFRSDVHQVLRNFNVFFFPSYTEGQPNSLIEALMTGLPVVASNIGPNKDTVHPGLLQQLVDADDHQAAAQKILEIKNNPAFADSLNYRKWAMENFDANLRFSEFYDCL